MAMNTAVMMLENSVHHFNLSLKTNHLTGNLAWTSHCLSYQALTTAFNGHSKDALFDESHADFDAAARLAFTFFQRSKKKEDYERWESIRISAAIFYAQRGCVPSKTLGLHGWAYCRKQAKAIEA